MKVEKTFEIEASQSKVWDFVSTPEKVGSCFPGCEEIEALGGEKYRATLKVEIGPIKTVFKLDFEETEKRPEEFAAYSSSGAEANRASRVKGESTLALSPISATRTQVTYTSEVSIVGRLAKFGTAMMKKKADSLGDEFVEALREQLEEPGAVAEARPPKAAAEPAGSGRRIAIAVAVIAIIAALAWYLAR